MKILYLCVVFVFSLDVVVEAEKILFFLGVATYSHRIAVWPLVQALAERGHQVTFLSIYPNKTPHPKVTEIVVDIDTGKLEMPDLLNIRRKYGRSAVKLMTMYLPQLGVEMCEIILNDSKIIKWAKTAKFDLVMIDFLYNDCGLGFAYKFKGRHAIFATSGVPGHWPEAFGFSAETHWIPDAVVSFPLPLAFLHRVLGTIMPFVYHYGKIFYMFPRVQKMLRDKLEIPDMPSLAELDRNTSLAIINTHFSDDFARSLPPHVIMVGGMHCNDKLNPLPKNITKFIEDGGDQGFIYVSFGSALHLSTASEEIQNMFFDALRNTKMRVLWKWEAPRPTNMSKNIYTEKWMPQQEILAHPKIRAFVTHGGLLGTQEATYHAVPMVIFPVFAEQDLNAERLERTGRGIILDIADLTKEKLENALNSILNNPSYRRAVQEASKRFRDRMNKPIETAVWWTEYIFRHKDATFMRPAESSNLFWFQRHLLDVWIFIFAFLFLMLFSFIMSVKILWSCMCKSKLRSQPTNTYKVKRS